MNIQNELLKTTETSSDAEVSDIFSAMPVRSVTSTVTRFKTAKLSPIRNVTSISIDDVVAEFTQDPEFAALLSDANRKIADQFYSDEMSLRSLRLKNGMTQIQLADAISTSQAQIAKLERHGRNVDVRANTVEALASVFGIPSGEMFEILRGDS